MEALQLSDIPNEEREQYLEDVLQEAGQTQRQELLVDFDRAYEEYQQEETPLVVKFAGETFQVPRSRPVGVTVWTARNQQNGQLTDDQYYTLLEKVFGKRFIDKMEESDAPLELVTKKVMQPLFEKWGVEGAGYKKKPTASSS